MGGREFHRGNGVRFPDKAPGIRGADTGWPGWFTVGIHPIRVCRVSGYVSRLIFPMFAAAKDMMTSKAAKAYVNDFIKPYGKVDELSIDSKRRRIDLKCQLTGEVSAIGGVRKRSRLPSRCAIRSTVRYCARSSV